VAKRPSRAARRRTHPCATTTPSMRRAIQASEEKNVDLAKRLGVGRKTIAKWKARDSVSDERMGPKNPRSSLLSQEDEVIILAYRWRTRLPLNYCHRRLKRLMPKLSRSALYRCLKRYGLGKVENTLPRRRNPIVASDWLALTPLAGTNVKSAQPAADRHARLVFYCQSCSGTS
jgi:transposase